MKVFCPHSVLGVNGRIGDNIFGPRRKAVSMKLDGTGVGPPASEKVLCSAVVLSCASDDYSMINGNTHTTCAYLFEIVISA